ncbi:GNAT family N-acetyltransferase [Sphaerisporangium sp. TRM90804]|uniref:GNAT family N-acetyltransferase n=1 Tax=Sphaerisporangium sp. TRM90804 TaxID=3031113 RepID=UPI00244BEB14|nr:GNAT family N-acetyltransferase [Sphaerisporangium sp. TRM90804]MDH2424329.1 GNAT family N-acetyltransferase [Sphaerisporangium sp. TRM90804]
MTEPAGGDAQEAARQYEAAARRCGVQVRELRELAEFELVFALFDDIWKAEPGNAPISVELMRAFSHSGNYVTGAFDGTTMVGASVAFLADPPGRALHSHVTGTTVGRGVGFALKLHQRAWALARGLDRVSWTFDPLVRRNAYFNITKLGGRPEAYLPAFYGAMEDLINAGDESDRLLLAWRLGEPHVAAACSGAARPPRVPPGAVVALADERDLPVAGGTRGRVLLVATPHDVEALRRAAPAAAKAWRYAVRDVLGGLIGDGARVTGFTTDGRYILERE